MYVPFPLPVAFADVALSELMATTAGEDEAGAVSARTDRPTRISARETRTSRPAQDPRERMGAFDDRLTRRGRARDARRGGTRDRLYRL